MDNKWWEYYAVRYFVGTVVGAGIVAFLNAEQTSPFANSLNVIVGSPNPGVLGVGLLAALGFAFCYIASAPVLTLHATRAHLRLSTIRSNWKSTIPVLVACATIVICWRYLPLSAAALSGLVIGLQLGLVI